ncbi:hypothetical protein [Enterococcus sp. AZ109]|uniref:LexA family protein n=1 Tax=Enterococcus sp. AZ109 TaxID=2774634 RepID=UPI003F2722A6
MKTANRILLCIFHYNEERPYPPTIREISDLVGLKSTSSTWAHVDKLKTRKLINYEERKPRTIIITSKGHKVVHELLNQKISSH